MSINFREFAATALMVACALTSTSVTKAATFTFAGYPWDQDDTPDVGVLLGGGANLGGAMFSSGSASTAAGDVGFPDQPAGSHALSTFNTSLTHGRLSGIAITVNTSRPLNLPTGNVGSATRHGIELGWTGGRSFVNGTGDDLVVYESGSNASSPENPMLRVRISGTNTFSDWHYFAPDAFQLYLGNSTEGAFATGIDLSSMGLSSGLSIDLIQIANLTATDRIVGPITHSSGGQNFGEGRVVFDGSSVIKPDAGAYATSYRDSGFGNATLDPDPIYVGMLGSVVVPEPASVVMLMAGMGVIALRRRR